MPTIDVDYAELECLLNVKLNSDMAKLDDILAFVKAEVKGFDEKERSVSIEMKDTARADLWSVEGLSRALQGYLNHAKGIKKYTVGKPAIEVHVNAGLYSIRPYICCSIIKDIHLSDSVIKGIMHLQEKLDQTHGRSRQKTSIGIYNLDLIKPPIEYTAVKPNAVRFVPLGFNEKMGLDEILEKHPKGIEYGHVVQRNALYPMLFDSEGQVLSFPPIINSNDLGKITEESRNLLVEVTGTLHKTVLNTLNLVTLALIDRGGKVFSAIIHYPQKSSYTEGAVITPNFDNKRFKLSVTEANRLLGLDLSAKKITKLLRIAGLEVEKVAGDYLTVIVPCYRVDVMHQVDIIEDIAIAYGYNNVEPVWRDLPTIGRAKSDQRYIDIARELMVGLGYQETLNTSLTNQENLFKKMNTEPVKIIELANPKTVTMTCLRNTILPSLMEFLSVNPSVEFPQKIFELGKTTLLDETSETRTHDEDSLAAVTTHANANFSEIKSTLDSFLGNFGVEWQVKETSHPTFIKGRAGRVLVSDYEVGVVGEINPLVLEAWRLENPAAAFEVDLSQILQSKFKSATKVICVSKEHDKYL
ncbi:MAG TPA: phenylalanine--tRNA ligase subunit beta [Candidatus Binatia bacterium]|nr:phenylalanine--tRNA ligase subunit beta [Candidatus Binatia bacterium]